MRAIVHGQSYVFLPALPINLCFLWGPCMMCNDSIFAFCAQHKLLFLSCHQMPEMDSVIHLQTLETYVTSAVASLSCN